MKAWAAFLLLSTALLAALLPPASAHSCSAASCGPCAPGEDHAHSDASGSCVSYADKRPTWGGGVEAGAGRDGAWADAKLTPGAGGLGALAALVVAGLMVARRS